ncbi:DUF6454 family protein [Pseudonocardia alaniniphila]|uniref:DUF6454 family protein n=1 Tax=Pseudonocardia alaniniphila TaxID=75291 RepID=A0ABS9TBN4_9PSEU|nr:DUF6454 family protein [Pseudonocardia alaniniphila]MCH6165917.1 DUF6454 family protein [Pseudonocardia alaniniphila]
MFAVGAAAAALALAALLPSAGNAVAEPRASSPAASGGDLASDLAAVDRSTEWQLLSTVKLGFPTYHPEGLVVTADRFYLTSTQIIEPTKTYPAPVDGFDRTPGKGIGHLFVIDRDGKLVKDVILGQGDVYHPGGIDLHGDDLWIPVAQYRPGSTAEIDRVDVRTLAVTAEFTVDDHIGGIVYDASTGHLVGNNWGSRTFYEWTPSGKPVATWKNPENLVDFQDCQYVPKGKMACGGITNLPQMPSAGGAKATYELGGVALLDLRSHTVVNEFPFQQWSAAGHVMTRNPLKLAADGNVITMWAAPDNGEETAGTQIYTWQAKVTAKG